MSWAMATRSMQKCRIQIEKDWGIVCRHSDASVGRWRTCLESVVKRRRGHAERCADLHEDKVQTCQRSNKDSGRLYLNNKSRPTAILSAGTQNPWLVANHITGDEVRQVRSKTGASHLGPSREKSDSKRHASQEQTALRIQILEERCSDSAQAYCDREAAQRLLQRHERELQYFEIFLAPSGTSEHRVPRPKRPAHTMDEG